MEAVERRPLEVVQRAGLLTLVEGQLDLGDGLTIIPAPGEMPGHQLLWLKAADGESYFLGDLFHHVLEFEELGRHPVWADAKSLEVSKLMLAERAASTGAQVFLRISKEFAAWSAAAPKRAAIISKSNGR